jgi:hypothetical protein
MSRETRFRRLLGPLVPRNSDICLAGQFLVLRPVRHVFCAVLFDKVGIAGAFRPRTLVFPTFAKSPGLEMRDLEGTGGKYYSEEIFKLPEDQLSAEICSDIEASALPFFRSLERFENLYGYMMHGDPQLWQREALHFRLELAMGNFDAARMLTRWHRKKWSLHETHSPDSDPGIHAYERRLCALLDAQDYPGIGRVLREIEAIIVAGYKVDHLWEPTPFLFETST